jgi:hypothetical protein
VSNSNEDFRKFTEYLATIPVENRASVLARAELLADNQTPAEAFKPPIITLGHYMEQEIPVPPVLVEPNLIVRGGTSAFISRAGFGKTQFNLNRQLKWAAGKALFDGIKTSEGKMVMGPKDGIPLKILLIENEGSAGMFQRQLIKMVNAGGYKNAIGETVTYLTDEDKELVKENILIWGDGGYSGMKLDDPNKFNEVKAGCEEWEPDIVFFDPLRSLWNGEENSSTEMNTVMDAMAELATDYNCAIIVPHHSKKGGHEGDDKMSMARGSTVLEGAVASMESWDKARGGDYREWSMTKHRYQDGDPILPIRCQWQSSDQWYKHVPYDEIEQTVIRVLMSDPTESFTIKEIQEETDESDNKIRNILNELVDAGKVKKYKSSSNGSGSTGNAYRMVGSNEDESESLGF